MKSAAPRKCDLYITMHKLRTDIRRRHQAVSWIVYSLKLNCDT